MPHCWKSHVTAQYVLLSGIYTIGVPPPIYEVKGIPPMYYEEAKGEKITSGSPSVLEGSEISGEVVAERDEHTPM